jgi:hypothetical protein
MSLCDVIPHRSLNTVVPEGVVGDPLDVLRRSWAPDWVTRGRRSWYSGATVKPLTGKCYG